MRLALLSLAFALLTCPPARAIDDIERMMVSYYIHAFFNKDEDTQSSKVAVVNYLAGIRDHLWWQCEYEVTVKELFDAAQLTIDVQRKSVPYEEFKRWATETPYGTIVFVSLKNEALLGKSAPCSNQ